MIVKTYFGLSVLPDISLPCPQALIQERWWRTKANFIHAP